MSQSLRSFAFSARRAGQKLVALVALLVLASSITPWPSRAQDRATLGRILNSNVDFRVRVQAAFALGTLHDPAALDPLAEALSDANPAIRAAAVASIARIGGPRALSLVTRAANDSAAAVRMQVDRARQVLAAAAAPRPMLAAAMPVPVVPAPVPAEAAEPSWSTARYVVFLGSLEDRSGYAALSVSQLLRREVESSLRSVRDVALVDGTVPPNARAMREIARRRLPRVRLDGSVSRMARQLVSRQMSVRCEVSFMLLDEPERVMRGMLSGAATGSGELVEQTMGDAERRLAERALHGAVSSALAGASRAIARAVQR